MKNEAVIRVQNVSKDFGQERVLHGVSRDFAPGQIHGIVGNNGSGKTVLMKCICGFLFPTEGEVTVNGEICEMRGKKLRPGDFAEYDGIRLTVE